MLAAVQVAEDKAVCILDDLKLESTLSSTTPLVYGGIGIKLFGPSEGELRIRKVHVHALGDVAIADDVLMRQARPRHGEVGKAAATAGTSPQPHEPRTADSFSLARWILLH